MKKIFLCLGLASALFAADNSVKFELTPTFSFNKFEGNLDLDDRAAPGVRLGYHFDDFWLDQLELGLEHYSNVKYSNTDRTNLTKVFLSAIKGIDVGEKFYFYGLAGGGYERFSNEQFDNESGGFGHYGAGMKYKLTDSLALRLETRDQINFHEANHNWVTTFGVSFGFGGSKNSSTMNTQKSSPEETSLEGKTISLEGHFDFDKTTINPAFESKIQNIAKVLEENEKYNTILEGHTDNTGSRAYNQKLSERRAQRVANELMKFGVDKKRIEVRGYGQDRPRSSNDTKEGRADNRRVEARFFLAQ
ncbi:OmpA family protein [Campylobacter vulpis]|uniref:OmpA family protein n=1 Tax=Campylobacter vulpis TaxID=1655500 RepID=UPI001BCF3D79|nr:OmpA family protein [Campylobacter vulpis]MBS4406543.1 OmpA family protein [Campylobacter vulpis]